MERKKNEKLTDLEQEEKEKAEYLRSKANELMQEQEDEIKHLNEVRLSPPLLFFTALVVTLIENRLNSCSIFSSF